MTIGIYIGRFQPFHKRHLITILTLFSKTNFVIVMPIYFEKNGHEILSSENPLPINYRYSYIRSVLEDYLKSENYYIIPINLLDKKLPIKVLRILKSTGEKDFLIYTRDLSRLIAYKLFSLIAKLYSLNLKVYYEKSYILRSREIRKSIINDEYYKIRHFLPKDLDRKAIMYIKYQANSKKSNLDSILRYFLSFLL